MTTARRKKMAETSAALLQLLRRRGVECPEVHLTPQSAVAKLQYYFETGIYRTREALDQSSQARVVDESLSHWGRYPILVFPEVDGPAKELITTGYGRLSQPDSSRILTFYGGESVYYSVVTQPDLFGDYLFEQISTLVARYGVLPIVGISPVRIPYDTVMGAHVPRRLKGKVPVRTLDAIDQLSRPLFPGWIPLDQFGPLMVDDLLERHLHYTGLDPKHAQGCVFFTNYDMFMREFLRYARQQVKNPRSGYCEVVESVTKNKKRTQQAQMPTIHLKREDGMGITMVNIGVGPANALTAMQIFAPLRPHFVLMLGHAGGLRGEDQQQEGMFVLADGYYRQATTTDSLIRRDVPIPPIAEINNALREAVKDVLKVDRQGRRLHMQSGTVASVDRRLWELSPEDRADLADSYALAVDMESSIIAAAGMYYKIPYGAFLCVSDMPESGRTKRAGSAQAFYRQTKLQHLMIALRAAEIIVDKGVHRLHSRKLRKLSSTPFR